MRRPFLCAWFGCVLAVSASAQNLTFWNTFDDDAAIENSVVGPPLVFYEGGGRPYQTVVATTAYRPGVSGGALTLGPAPYVAGIRTHAIELPNPGAVLNAERGTIEAWYFNRQELAPYVDNSHTLFGQMPDCAYEAGMMLYVNHPAFWSTARVTFAIKLCGSHVEVTSPVDGIAGAPLVNALNQWLHFAAVWDRAGIAGTTDRVRLYVNGIQVARSTASNWGTTFGPVAAVAGAADWDLPYKFFVDEMKFWDAAKTTFGQHFGVYAAQIDGAGSAILGNYCGPPGWIYFTSITTDPLNANGGLGYGPWSGLFISPEEVVIQGTSQAAPYVGWLDGWGDSRFLLPAGTLGSLYGTTFYMVTHAVDPLSWFAPNFVASWPTQVTVY